MLLIFCAHSQVFSVLALLCNDDVEVKLTFIFMFFARNGSKPGGMDSKQFADMLDRVGIGVYKVLGFSPPPKQFAELAILGLFGKKGQVIRDVLNFKECWDWCQDDVEVRGCEERSDKLRRRIYEMLLLPIRHDFLTLGILPPFAGFELPSEDLELFPHAKQHVQAGGTGQY